MNKVLSVSICGCGERGGECYGRMFDRLSDKYKIVALCDTNKERLDRYAAIFKVDKENCYDTEEVFFEKRRSDVLLIATLDKDHVHQCLKGMKWGYDILMEKPITDDYDECMQLLETQKKYGNKVLVCHVLRYRPAFMKGKELLDKKVIGDLVAIQAIEQVRR